MRLAVLAATVLACSILPAVAQDKPAVDLVGGIMLGAEDGATWSFLGQITGVLKETAPGTFETKAGDMNVKFTVVEKSKCLYDLTFIINDQVQGGLELDANKLKTVTYSDAKPNAGGWTDYAVAIDGAKGVVQSISSDNELSETDPSSTVSTSLTQDQLQADVAALQAGFCPAAA